MDILLWIVFGLVVGLVAKLIMPGNDPGGIILTIVLGIVGAMLGGWLGRVLGLYREGEAAGFIMAVVGAVIVLGKRIVTPSAPTFSAAAPCFCDRPGVRRQSGRATHIGKRRTVGGDDLPPAPARLWSAKQAGNCWKRVVRENVVPQLLEPCGPWQCPRRRPRATTGRALCVVVRRDERTRQPFVGRNDGGSCGERREQTGFEHSGDGLRGPSIRALPP